MLYKGKRNGYYLYELTETDLIWEECDQELYHVGDVLLFASKKDIALGLELVKADDLPTALDYLEGAVEYTEAPSTASLGATDQLRAQLTQSETKSAWLEGLLHELTADLESQRYSNQMLIAQMENLREQLNIEQVSRSEVIDDLESMSAETFKKDKELQEVIDAKILLEQELAARICELLELDAANADLQKRLESQVFEEMPPVVEDASDTHASAIKLGVSDAQVLTSPSGKQILINHEFPRPEGRARRRGFFAFGGLARVALLVVLGVVVFLAGSVIATAELNDLSLGESLDITLKTFLP